MLSSLYRKNTSWHKVGKWYNKLVDKSGSYYHEHLVIPRSLSLLHLSDHSSILDLGCGQGILERKIPRSVHYEGIDNAPSLIDFANKNKNSSAHLFYLSDASLNLPIKKNDFSHAAIILALQNIEYPADVIKNASRHLGSSGRMLVVLNHPCFRIPRQTSWEIDTDNKLEYRRINRYVSPLKIPVNAHPGQGNNSPITWSFHQPLSYYFSVLNKFNFWVETMEEWCSDKVSVGKMGKMENRARSEFPLFLAILAVKK